MSTGTSGNLRYQKAPNGVVNVMHPTEAFRILKERFDARDPRGEGLVYVPKDGEVRQVLAAMRAGLPVALIGPPGVGKTTLAAFISDRLGLPLTTVSCSRGMRLHQLIGHVDDMGGEPRYVDGPVSMAARASERNILYLDEAVELPTAVFTSMSSLLDHSRTVRITDTAEDLSAKHVAIVLAFNPPEIDELDKLPSKATLDRLVIVRFAEPTIHEMNSTLMAKYEMLAGTRAVPDLSGETLREVTRDEVMKALNAHIEELTAVISDLKQKAGETRTMVVKFPGTRSLENATKLIAAGLSPHEAAIMALVNPMVPVSDRTIDEFLDAAKETVRSRLG